MLKIILNMLFLFAFNFKTQNPLDILIGDSLTYFFILMFYILLHHFNCLNCFETKVMTKTMDINFISDNIKGIQISLKIFKIFSYLKENISHNGVLFLQEIHTSSKDEIKWKDEFKGELFFSHGKLIYARSR